MKRLLTILLSTLIVFSSCLMISADEPTILNGINNGTITVTNEGEYTKVQIVPNEGYTYPSWVSHGWHDGKDVEDYSYDSTTGVITVKMGDCDWVIFEGTCPGSETEGLSLNAYQDSDKNLIIEATGDNADAFLDYLCTKNEDVISAKLGAFYGYICNWEEEYFSETSITRGDGKVVISKDSLVDGGYVNGDYILNFHGIYDNLALKVSLDLGVKAPTITQADSIKVSGYVSAPVEGQSTSISDNTLKVTDQDGNTISSYDESTKTGYTLSWCEAITGAYGYTNYVKTEDETFVADKDYYLMITYKYVMKNKSAPNVEIVDSNLELTYVDNFFGMTGGTWLQKTHSTYYVMKYTAGRAQVKTTNTNDLSKDLVEKVAIKNSANEVQSLVKLSDDEKAALYDGKNVEIQMQVNSQSSVTKEDVTKVDTKIASDGLTKGTIYDINLYTNIEGETNQRKVTETTTKTVISFPLEERLVNTDSSINREYKVVRVHEGETTVLPATYDASTKSITFKTDKFSTYAICYKDTKKEEKKEETNTSSNTSSTKAVTCEEAMNSKNWTWSESKKACVYRVTNTSAK